MSIASILLRDNEDKDVNLKKYMYNNICEMILMQFSSLVYEPRFMKFDRYSNNVIICRLNKI
jgi:hypothetical protein